ncbi:MAG: efflux RND transporter periplasmic adaptor subunit [Bacteroidales bacterium]
MKKTKNVVWLMLVTGLIVACTPSEKKEPKQEKEKIQPVKIAQLTQDTVERTLSYTANLEAWKVVYFAPAKPGRIKKINVDEGDHINKGQELVQMDQTELTQALIQLDNARTNFQRMDTLYNLNSISKQQYDQAKTQLDLAKANIEFLQENTSLKAPFPGIVTAKHYEDGEIYSGAPNTQAGKAAVVTLMQISPLKVMVNISERQFPYIKTGMKAQIKSDLYPNAIFTGQVYRIYPTIDPATRTFQTEIKIDNPNEKLRPGMFVTVHITIKDEATMVVPAIAVIKQQGTNNCYVFIAENGTARKIPVKIGARFDDQFEIISDELETGMDLIVAGQPNLRHGDSIKIKKNN